MAGLVDDDVLGTFAVVAEPDAVGPALLTRFDGLVDRFSVYPGTGVPIEVLDPVVAALT
jgi:hypothetical protein